MSRDRLVGAVILAAGASRRFGGPKQLLVVDGRTLLQHAVDTALATGLAPIVAVVPVWLSPPTSRTADSIRWIRNPSPERGLSLSLQLGLAAVRDEVAALMILLGDQPGVAQSTIAAILAARGDRPIVATRADGVLAPPVLLERSHFHLLDELSGDIGLRTLLRSSPELVHAVEVAAHAVDIDTAEDLGRIVGP